MVCDVFSICVVLCCVPFKQLQQMVCDVFTICGSPCPLVVVTKRRRLCCGNQMKKRETQR